MSLVLSQSTPISSSATGAKSSEKPAGASRVARNFLSQPVSFATAWAPEPKHRSDDGSTTWRNRRAVLSGAFDTDQTELERIKFSNVEVPLSKILSYLAAVADF
ncbi:unnamed protein product [Pleuronectes platessa]|uniref:Uncharacterized protein n=1 Tax=Pleuronectes platessa TaxID=8262 RepID=A0A9N7TV10_PLEPL|nr:unnamed protein product [Pleuronectes platessa]